MSWPRSSEWSIARGPRPTRARSAAKISPPCSRLAKSMSRASTAVTGDGLEVPVVAGFGRLSGLVEGENYGWKESLLPPTATHSRRGRNDSRQRGSLSRRWWSRGVVCDGGPRLPPVVRRLDHHLNVVRVALLESGGRDAHELALGAQFLDRARAGIKHRLPQPAEQLIDDG